MFGGVLSKLLTAGGDDAARAVGKTATGALDNLLPTATKTATNQAAKKAATTISDDALAAAKRYVDTSVTKTSGKPYRIHDLSAIDEDRAAHLMRQGYTTAKDSSGKSINLGDMKPIGADLLDNLNPTGGVFVDYNPQARARIPLADNIKTLADTAKMNPDDLVDIYRGLPDNVEAAINPGDFITTNPELAKSYGGNVHKMQVRYGDILDDMNEPLGEEYIFRPQQQEVFSPRFKRQTGNPDVDARISEVVDMSPDEYLQKAFEATDGRLGGNYDSWLASNAVDPATTKSYAEAMRKGDEFPMAYIDNAFGSQDGRNRALAVKMAGGKSMPVGVVPEMTTEQATKYYTDLLNNSTSDYSRMVYQRKLDGLSKK